MSGEEELWERENLLEGQQAGTGEISKPVSTKGLKTKKPALKQERAFLPQNDTVLKHFTGSASRRRS